jgi:hypothetical protein
MSVTPKQTLADQARSKPLFFWIALLVGVVMLGLYLFAGVMIARYGTVTRDSGWQPERRDGQWYVAEVDPQGAAAGKLQAGDLILAVNDDPRITSIDSPDVWWVIARRMLIHSKSNAAQRNATSSCRWRERRTTEIWACSSPTLRPVSASIWSA